MRAHQLDADGVILNNIEVESLYVLPNLVADIGGSIGDSIIDDVVVPKPPYVPTADERRAVIQAEIDDLERSTMLNRGSRELEIVSIQDLATRQAATLQPSTPEKTVEEITAELLAARPYYVKLVALNDQVSALRAVLVAI
jgi:hypothetical protein